MKKIIIFCLFFLTLNVSAYCAQQSKIELTDGSVINGEIVSFVNSVYTINTAAFGKIEVEAAKISKIESLNYASPQIPLSPISQANNPAQSQVSAYGQALMKNPENTAIVAGLASDPQFQELVKDPQIADAAKKGDINALIDNPKFRNIINSTKVQDAVKKLKH